MVSRKERTQLEKTLVTEIFVKLKELSDDQRFEIDMSFEKMEVACKKALHELYMIWDMNYQLGEITN